MRLVHGVHATRIVAPRRRTRLQVVGLTERFAETVLLIARAVGIPQAMYRRMNVGGTQRDRQRLLQDPEQRAAIANLSAFDSEVRILRFVKGSRASSSRVVLRQVESHTLVVDPPPTRRCPSGWQVYAHFASLFERRLASERPDFQALVRTFKVSQHGYFGGLPPRDQYMVCTPRVHP